MEAVSSGRINSKLRARMPSDSVSTNQRVRGEGAHVLRFFHHGPRWMKSITVHSVGAIVARTEGSAEPRGLRDWKGSLRGWAEGPSCAHEDSALVIYFRDHVFSHPTEVAAVNPFPA